MVLVVGIALGYVAVGVIAFVLLLDDDRPMAIAVPAAIVWPVWLGPYMWKRMRRPAPGSNGDRLSEDEPG